MWFSLWLRNRLRPDPTLSAHAPARARATFRPRLETLESRWVPSTLTVMNNLDSGAGSLRADIAAAKKNDTIIFDPALAGKTITLTSGELDITKQLTIQGLGEGRLTVSGDNLSRVFEVDPNVKVALSGLTISDGLATGIGGGILNQGALTITDCTISDNHATGNGGGIINLGTLKMDGCLLVDNRAGDTGAGLFNLGGATVASSAFQTNAAGFDGGGIANWAQLAVRDSSFGGNTAVEGGAVSNSGGLTFVGCAFTSNTATGVTAFTGRYLPGEGGAIYNSATLDVRGSILQGNTASDFGGGVYNAGTATVRDSILAGNTAGSEGGGIFNGASGTLAIRDSLVWCNFAPLGSDLYNAGLVSAFDSVIGHPHDA